MIRHRDEICSIGRRGRGRAWLTRAGKPRRREPKAGSGSGLLRYKVGDAECTALYDGIWEKAHDPKYFGNATTAEIKQALANAGLTTAFVPIPITVFVIKLNGKLVLCDVGGGDQVQPSIQNLFSFPAR